MRPPRCSSGSDLIEFSPETGSTNADAIGRLRSGEPVPDGTWFVADRQTGGRGRHGREWFDGAGNFMGSTVVGIRFGDPAPGTLALVAGLAVHAAAQNVVPAKAGTSGGSAQGSAEQANGPGSSPERRELLLKWPNDLMIGGAKLAGVLLEREGDAIVVGIGVNLAAAPSLPDRETISLADLGVTAPRDDFARSLANAFAQELERWRKYGLGPVVNRWLTAAHPVGTPLTVGVLGELPLRGAFAGLTGDGALQLRAEDGTTHVVQSGEVNFAP